MRLSCILALIASLSLGFATACFAVDTPYSVTLEGDLRGLQALTQTPARKGNRFQAIRLSTQVHSLGRLIFVFNSQKLPAAKAVVLRNGREENDRVIPTLLKGYVWQNRGGLRNADRSRAALAVINGTLRIQFAAPHQPRPNLYSISAKLIKSSRVKAKFSRTHQSMFLKTECGDAAHPAHEKSVRATSPETARASTQQLQRVVTISTEADPEWYQRYGEFSNAEIAATLNAAEAIYERQLGVRFAIVKQHVYPDQTTSPYVSTNASQLLSSFAKNPDNSINLGVSSLTFLQDVDVRYLFTGKDLDGNTIGIAYVGALCWSSKDAYGLVQDFGRDMNIITFLHELGHTFGANHDITDPLSIMYPTLGAKSYFSSASLAEINRHMGYFGQCISEELLSPNLANAALKLKSSRSKDGKRLVIKGTLTAITGTRIAGVPVQLTLNENKVYSIVTNKDGAFKLPLRLAKLKMRRLTVLGQTAQTPLAKPSVLQIRI